MTPVQGYNVTLYKHNDDGTDTPFGYAQECSFQIQQEFKEVTDYSSAFFKKFKPDVSSWQVSSKGLVGLSNYSYLFMTTLQLARTSILVKFVVDNGSGGLVIYSGSAYISSISLNANFKDAATYSVTLQGTSAYSQSGTTVTPTGIIISGGTVTRKEYTCPADGLTVTVSDLIGISRVVSMSRGTSAVSKIIYTDTPTGTQILINTTTGVVSASTDQPFVNTEELVFDYQ